MTSVSAVRHSSEHPVAHPLPAPMSGMTAYSNDGFPAVPPYDPW